MRYRIGETIVMEETSDGILLRPSGAAPQKLSWEETAGEMAASREDWSVWERTAGDGLDHLRWQVGKKGRVAEPSSLDRARARPAKRR
jgi:hypothetical protein